MGEHLASTLGTEKDRANCPFYFKVGACKFGDRCTLLHNKPSVSPTLLLSKMYRRPDELIPGVDAQGNRIEPSKIRQHFEDFFKDVFQKLSKYGKIKKLYVCDNLANHMIGNVYVQFSEEEHAANALKNLTGTFYSGHLIIVDFSPVTNFRDGTCAQNEENLCHRSRYCNLMHPKRIGRELKHQLFGEFWHKRGHRRSKRRSRRPYRFRSHEERHYGGRGSGRRFDYRDRYYESRGRRHKSPSPEDRRRRSRSPEGRRNRSPVREGSVERRAKIDEWLENSNKANAEGGEGSENGGSYNDHMVNGNQHYDYHLQQAPPQQGEHKH